MYLDSKRAAAPRWNAALLLTGLLALPSASSAAETPPVYGWIEWAALEPSHTLMRAKLDTGARTSSLSAQDIERFTRKGFDWVRFVVPIPADDSVTRVAERVTMELPLQREARIKRHGAPSARRPVVHVELCLGGHIFTTPVSLADRSRFNYPLLLGRSALRGRAVIDVERTYQRGIDRDTCAPVKAVTAADDESTRN